MNALEETVSWANGSNGTKNNLRIITNLIEVDLVEENAGVSAARTSKYQDLVGVGDICAGAVSGESW
jgi:hypothetical protein